MTRDNVMSTPIFDELLREMAQRVEPHAPTQPAPEQTTAPEPPRQPGRRRHRAE